MSNSTRPKGPYGKELLWGDDFITRYKDALEDLYLTDEVRNAARDTYFAAFSDGEHSMAAEKWGAVDAYCAAGFPDNLYACRFIVEDVIACGCSRNSALISIQAYIMLVETGVLDKPAERHLPIDPFAVPESDVGSESGTDSESDSETDPDVPFLGDDTPTVSLVGAGSHSGKPASGEQEETVSIERKCSNCVYSRNPDHCNGFGVCEDWRYAKPTPSYYPTWDDMRGGMFSDFLSRSNDTYIS